jgi:hypothetical protein
MWLGSGSTPKVQIASSNSADGPWTFLGPDGTSVSSYTLTNPATVYKIQKLYHTNKRYFRYQLLGGASAATLDDLIMSYSP